MKKILIATFCLLGFTATRSWADDVSASSATATSIEETPATTSTNGSDVFVTLSRQAFSTSDLPTNTDVVTPAEFQKINAQTAGDAVANQTSIQTRPQGGLGSLQLIGMRGSTTSETLVLVDGRPYSGFALGPTDLSEIPTESIDHIEIIRGGASALYGPNAMGGVINIITKRAAGQSTPTADFGFEDGSFGRQAYRGSVGAQRGPVDFFLSGNLQDESGFRDNSYARTDNFNGNIGFSMGAAGKIMVDGSTYGSRIGLPGVAFDFDNPNFLLMPVQYNNHIEKIASTPTEFTLTDTSALRTTYLLPLPMNSLMTAHFNGMQRNLTDTDVGNPPGENFDSFLQTQSNGGDLQFNLPLGFVAGGSFLHDHETNNDQLDLENSFNASIENWGTFVEDTVHIDQLTLIPGLRYDQNSHSGDSTSPRLQAIDDLTDILRLNASAAHSFQAPSIDDLYFSEPDQLILSNPNLRPEKAWTFDGGFEVHNDSNSFSATYYFSNVTDLIQEHFDDLTGFYSPINVGQAKRQGVEVAVNNVLNRFFGNSLNYTFLNNRGIPPGSTSYVPLEYSPAHTVNDTLSVHFLEAWRADFTGRYLSSSYAGNDNTDTKLSSRYIQDLRLSYQIWKSEFYFGISDLFNKRYEESAGFPLPGRTFFGGINLKLL